MKIRPAVKYAYETNDYFSKELQAGRDSTRLRMYVCIKLVAGSAIALAEGTYFIFIKKPFNFIARTVCDLTGKDSNRFKDHKLTCLIKGTFLIICMNTVMNIPVLFYTKEELIKTCNKIDKYLKKIKEDARLDLE